MPRTASNIAKRNRTVGHETEKAVRDLLLASFPELTEDDIRATIGAANGEDLLLSSAARKALCMTQHEVKSRKNPVKDLIEWPEQAASHGKHEPVVWYKQTGKVNPFYCIVRAEFLIKLMRLLYEKV